MTAEGGLSALLRRRLPILEWGPQYSGQTLVGDLVAAAIVSMMLIPQSLAYALLAGLPPQVGLYAAMAPLLGLFGTVVGMIEIFGSQSSSASNPIQLAQGISIALYNTAMGLIVAIPSMIFYRHFRAKVDSLVVEMEQQAIKLVDFAHGERK